MRRPAAWRALFVLLAALVATIAQAPVARAQWNDPEVTASVTSQRVEVGEPFQITIKVMTDEGAPVADSPTLKLPAAIASRGGPTLTSQRTMSWIQGRSTSKQGVSATWTLEGKQVGRFTLAGPTMRWNGALVKTNPVQIEVVAATGQPRRTSPFGSMLPGGPGGLSGWPFGQAQPADDDGFEESRGLDDDGLSMPKAPDPQVFVRAVADKKAAVVGEQVTITFYLYQRISLDLAERHEAPLSDFVRVPLLKNPGTDPPITAIAGGERYLVRLLDKIAAFPVKTGDLHTGSLMLGFGKRGRQRVERRSDDLVVRVTEPPKEGRPAGYAVGDVGRWTMTASVQPRKIDQGGSVAVTVKVSGTGNLPQSLNVPARTGLEWLDPEKRDAIEPANGVVQGFRTFGYVVRVGDAGTVDLGHIDLPYWDPASRRYEVASVKLGAVDVTPTMPSAAAMAAHAAAKEDPDGAADPLANVPGARLALAAFDAPPGALAEGPALWLMLAAPPLLFGFVTLGARGARALTRRRATAEASSEALAARALDEATAAEKRGDAKALAAAAERALHHAIEGATGLRSRGVLLRDLAAELTGRGVAAALSNRTADALGACESLRFDPHADQAAQGELAKQARDVVHELGRSASA